MVEFKSDVFTEGGICVTQEKKPDGDVIVIEIVREKALNALSSATFRAFHEALDLIVPDRSTQVVFLGRGRAFSAGGDVRALRGEVVAAGAVNTPERQAVAHKILKIEYDFLTRLETVSQSPVVDTMAVADGYAFGAGQGLFQACGNRLVTSNAVLAMPECRIGLVPDCGASHFYARLPGSVGMFAALTGFRFSGGDALALGLADGAVPAGWRGESLTGCGCGGVPLQTAIAGSGDVANAESALRRGIDDVFSAASVKEVVQAAGARAVAGEPWAIVAAKAMQEVSPTALRETFRVMRLGYSEGGGLVAALARELEADSVLSAAPDFMEGVRAALVDKDGKPKWEECEL